MRNFEILRIRSKGWKAQHSVLAFEAEEWIAPPKRELSKEMPAPAHFGSQDLWIHHYAGAEVFENSKFPSVVLGNNLIIPRRFEKHRLQLSSPQWGMAQGYFRRHNEFFVLRSQNVRRVELEEAIYVGFRSPGNWSHWLANTLATLASLKISEGLPQATPVLVHERALAVPQILQSLKALVPQTPIYAVKPGCSYQVDHLIWPDAPIYDTPMAEKPETRILLSHHRTAATLAQKEIVSSVDQSEGARRGGRFFLAPKDDQRKRVPKEVLFFFTSLGFEQVELDQLSFNDQVSLFQRAGFLAGPAGSDIAGLLLANPSVTAFTWVHEFSGPNSNYYANLAAISRSTLIHFESRHFDEANMREIESWTESNTRN